MNFKKHHTLGTLVSAGITISMVMALGGVAHADPPAGSDRQIALVGSETTTPVMNALANDPAALAIGGVLKVASFNATGSATINTHPSIPACGAITRPNGSTDGRNALLASYTTGPAPGDGCIQGARSSSAAGSATTPSLVYIPFAKEAISFAISNTSNFSKNITLVKLRQIFQCTATNNNLGANFAHGKNYEAMLPQDGSGTRSYWIGQMQYPSGSIPTTGQPAAYPCVQNGTSRNPVAGEIEEHNASQVNNQEIVPFSAGQFASQVSGVIGIDVRSAARLGQIDDKNPFAADFGLQRNLFNAFPADYIDGTANATGTPLEQLRSSIQTLFKGSGAQICTNAAAVGIVSRYGLRPPTNASGVANCGDTTSRT